MATLEWDKTGERRYENGVEKGVFYPLNSETGAYDSGFPWNGLVSVTESPSGAEVNKQYADNRVYASLRSAEEFGATIEAFTYPDEAIPALDGSATPTPGVALGQQVRGTFGFAYVSKVGNDLNPDAGEKIHLVYGATANPSEKSYTTINESPEAATFSWEITTDPVAVGSIAGVEYKPLATVTVDTTKEDADAVATLKEFIYGTAGTDPSLPMPSAVVAMFTGAVTTVAPTVPTYDDGSNTLTIPSVTGVEYLIDGQVQAAGPIVLTENKIVTAKPLPGYKFPANTDDDWLYGSF